MWLTAEGFSAASRCLGVRHSGPGHNPAEKPVALFLENLRHVARLPNPRHAREPLLPNAESNRAATDRAPRKPQSNQSLRARKTGGLSAGGSGETLGQEFIPLHRSSPAPQNGQADAPANRPTTSGCRGNTLSHRPDCLPQRKESSPVCRYWLAGAARLAQR